MPVPTHRDDCSTLMYKTTCQYCGDSVYYFSCSCGSKVFFDYPTSPWGPHERRCWRYLIRLCLDLYELKEEYIISFIERYSFETKQDIPRDVKQVLKEMKGSRRLGKLRIAEIPPTDEARSIIGILRVINKNINFFRKFAFDNNYIGKMLLGRLVEEAYFELIIREGRKDDNTCSEFTAYIPLAKFELTGVHLDELVVVELIPHQIVDGRYIWLVDQINRLK